jgi:tRNA-specific adenosine deaminase 3
MGSRLIRGITTETSLPDLQHLRKFAKANDLPEHLRVSLLSPVTDATQKDADSSIAPLYLLVGPTSLVEALPEVGIHDLLVCMASVPLLAPTSEAQANSWSAKYWPTVYKKSNPFGPHSSLVSRAEVEVGLGVYEFINLATMSATASESSGIGASVGAVIVDRSRETPRIIATAGDARWHGGDGGGSGNVMAHAALRAIGMVAQRLKMADQKTIQPSATTLDHHERKSFLDKPLHEVEDSVFNNNNISPDGYLCHGLEIYLTHEPCIMCSMAILHSRFSRVVFKYRMPQTGGLCSGVDEPGSPGGLGYGLFWRKELNWSLLAWQWCVKGELVAGSSMHA